MTTLGRRCLGTDPILAPKNPLLKIPPFAQSRVGMQSGSHVDVFALFALSFSPLNSYVK